MARRPADAGSKGGRRSRPAKTISRYEYKDVAEPRTPETGHTSLLGDEEVASLPMDGAWSGSLDVIRVSDEDGGVVVDMDPHVDPTLLWSGKRSQRDVGVLPLQRNEVIAESRIAQIVDRARQAGAGASETAQPSLFADLEKELREDDKTKRVEFYTHDEGWKNKLICGDSLPVIESLLRYEGLRGRMQMIYVDPPVRHHVRRQLPAAHRLRQERPERPRRRRPLHQGVPRHLGSRGPLVPLLPPGAPLPLS